MSREVLVEEKRTKHVNATKNHFEVLLSKRQNQWPIFQYTPPHKAYI